MRLDKFLVDCGVGSRSQVKTFLKKKQVTVNGQVETSPKAQIDEKQDQIAFQGQALTHETFVYYLLNKPQGVISATEDARHKTCRQDLSSQGGWYPGSGGYSGF